MYPGIHNFSEIGKLNKVLLHRPGKVADPVTVRIRERLRIDLVDHAVCEPCRDCAGGG